MTVLNNHSVPVYLPYLLYDSDSVPYPYTPSAPFALTDAFIEYAGKTSQGILHFWKTDPLVILGMMDTKLPAFDSALSVIRQSDYALVVRNSGGLAVVSDPGILNVSLIFPEEEQRMTINEGYQRMHALIAESFQEYGKTIDAVEIPDSYCPGDYDLSIDGKKIAGISQRRIKGGIAIMIYLSVSGNQLERGQLIQDFYQKGNAHEQDRWHFPDVRPASMTTLEAAFETSLSVRQVKYKLEQTLRNWGAELTTGTYSEDIHMAYQAGMKKMKKRNEKLL